MNYLDIVTHLMDNEENVVNHGVKAKYDRETLEAKMSKTINIEDALKHLDCLLNNKKIFKAREGHYIHRETPFGE